MSLDHLLLYTVGDAAYISAHLHESPQKFQNRLNSTLHSGHPDTVQTYNFIQYQLGRDTFPFSVTLENS